MPARNADILDLSSGPYFGAGDFGSNKAHFIVCDRNGKIVAEIGCMPRLGNGMSEPPTPPFFTEKSFTKAVNILREAKALFDKYGLDKRPEFVRCVGTAALRDTQKAIEAIEAKGNAKEIAIAKMQMEAMKDAFFPYSIEIISEEEESALVAKTMIDEFRNSASPEIRALTTQYPVITGTHCGGRSTEIFDLAKGSIITRNAVLHFGVHTHLKTEGVRSENLPPDDTPLLNEKLLEKWRVQNKGVHEKRLFAASGGQWRPLGPLMCEFTQSQEGTRTFSAEKAQIILNILSGIHDPGFFRKHGVPEKRIQYMAAGSKNLSHFIKYTQADEIVFMNEKMVLTIGRQLCEKHKPKSIGLLPPSFLSNPSQRLRA